jgi:hypothetical protein
MLSFGEEWLTRTDPDKDTRLASDLSDSLVKHTPGPQPDRRQQGVLKLEQRSFLFDKARELQPACSRYWRRGNLVDEFVLNLSF